jgi:hypothetical protein
VVGDTRLEGDINMLHTSNTASIKLNSNVVTEFPRSKKLIKYPRVALTSASQTVSGYEGHFVSQTTGSKNGTSNRQAWALFDNVLREKSGHAGPHFVDSTVGYDSNGDYTRGDSLGGVSGDWAYIRLPDKIQLQSVDLWARYDSQRNPIDATVLGSLNGTNWNVIGSWTGATFTAGESTSFTINSIQYYDYIGFVFEKIEAGSSGTYVNIHEIELYGTPEYDPEADGVDVVVKSLPNVPNTDWLEVYYEGKNYTSGVVQDETTNDRDGVLYGDTSLTSADGIHKFDFDGNGDYIKTTLTGFTGTTVTFSAWVFMDSVAEGRANTIMGLGNWGSTGSASWIAVGTSGVLETGNKGIASCASSVQANTLTGRWLHITGIVSSGDFRFYQDGQLIKSLTTTGTINYGTNPVLYLATRADSSGNPEATRYFDCKIANARLFNRALTSDEIYQLYAYQKEYFGHGDLGMTLKAGRLGIGTSEPKAALDVRGDVNVEGLVNNAGMHWLISHTTGGNVAYTSTGGNWFSSTASSTIFGTVLRTENNAPVSAWNSLNGYFTAPEDGLYLIDLALFINGFDTGRWGGFQLLEADGTLKERQYTFYTANLANDDTVGYSKTVYMKTGESFAFYTTAGTVTLYLSAGPPGHTTMNIYKIS